MKFALKLFKFEMTVKMDVVLCKNFSEHFNKLLPKFRSTPTSKCRYKVNFFLYNCKI